MSWALTTPIEIGTSWTFSSLFSAVTTIVSMPPLSLAPAASAACDGANRPTVSAKAETTETEDQTARRPKLLRLAAVLTYPRELVMMPPINVPAISPLPRPLTLNGNRGFYVRLNGSVTDGRCNRQGRAGVSHQLQQY